MPITLSSALNFLILLTIFILLLHPKSNKTPCTHVQFHCLRRRRIDQQSQHRAKDHAKPGWVKTEALRLLALMKNAGCRTIASTFNAKFVSRRESVSKSFVTQLKKKSRYEWLRLRKDF